ncbi:translation initiation factor IF-2 [Salisediminibacterium selenitireducens]|uniref:Translation initiation factor IF-2 n=1 Tax=Bacillus selenitireducens (strain ATCC 700615 / DSM 15326 / MLS10) TaxID=439292 RepID=D6XU09_BACIE|nr:translation initiation factor IF-2 [Salisediminibacterium selenitireducens]ADH99295.1 translation initiation factor IF-2 [[Bacillus] selenitireducens MLS10]
MSKKRIYEYAKENNTTSKAVIDKLKGMGIEVSNHMSVIDRETMNKLEGISGQKGKDTKQESSAPKPDAKKPQNQTSANQKNDSRGGNQPNKGQGGSKKPQSNQQKPGQRNQPNQGKPGNQKQQGNKGPNKNKKNRRNDNRQQPKNSQPSTMPRKLPEKVLYTPPITVGDFAEKIHREPSEVIKKLMFLGVMATINQELEEEALEILAEEYGITVEEEVIVDETDFESIIGDQEEDDAKLQERPAVVTIMGHVDHGKTTLLDSIRHTKVVAGEAGGITQHIGAYQVVENDKKITFLDTPGHAAFTTMRARGAQVTDITILVVAADDGVMPQTIEAINHAKAAEVPIIVAVNKIDKEGANPDRVMQELTEHGLVAEAWGGDTIFVEVSALNAKGIDDLLEMILLVTEVEELKANPDREAYGTVVEAELDKGRGPVATLLVQGGTLHVGDPIVVGNAFGKVRAMVNDLGRRVKTADPSMPVEITGLNAVPQAGDRFMVFKDEKKARQIGEQRAMKQREAQRRESSRVSLDDLFNQIQQGDIKEINVIVKADVQGSAEAMKGSLEKIEVEGVKINIIHTGVGAIAESDVILASASNAVIIGFNVRPDVNAKRTAEVEGVDIRLHRVIYDAIEEIESAMKGLLDPIYQEKVIGQAEVRQVFKVSKVGSIAGSYVTDGKITRHSSVRVIRDGVVVFEGEVNDLKRFKDDVKEVAKNYECGITIENFNDVKEGDIIEAYIMEEVKRK